MGKKEIIFENDEEILNYLKEALQKEKSVKELSETMDISEFEVIGYIRKLKDQGFNITYIEKSNGAYLYMNDHPDFTRRNVYRIKEDDEMTKVAVISDLRFGSKNEQLEILNDMYKKFALDGIKYVLVGGNLIEGVYKGKQELEFGESLITNDSFSQVEHLVDCFPKVEGIKTLFITGKLEHNCKNINVGEQISLRRDDLIYLGPKSATIYFNEVSVQLEQLKNGTAYTFSYEAQKYSRSLAPYEDYDITLLSGTRSFQYLPDLRNSHVFTIPSVVSRTAEMRSKSINNDMGVLNLDIYYTKNGKLKRLVSNISPYYEPSKENYLTVKKLNLKKTESGFLNTRSNNVSNHTYFDTLDKIYNLMKKEQTFSSLMEKLNASENELVGIIEMLKQYGRPVEIKNENGILIVEKGYQKKVDNQVKLPKEQLHKKELLVVSDTHYGSIYSQPSMVNTACYEAYNRGITDFLHIGDICDGDYSRIRPIHVHEVFLYGATGQLDYTVKTLPKYKGVKWHIITGSHDQTHLFNYGLDFGKQLAKIRDDVEFLGQDKGMFMVDNCKIELFHPGGGASRILSTKPQNGIDGIASLTKPNISLRGHYHKVYYMFYRNIHTLLCPCNVDQSSFMMKNELPNKMGNFFLTIYYDDLGNVQYLDVEPMIFSVEDVIKNDYENPIKYMKNKILTKKRYEVK